MTQTAYGRSLVVTALMFAGLSLIAADASYAQSFFNFGQPSRLSREMVRFRTQHAPGTIIVSFGDRRLYKILRRGRAISYPIAIPRNISRWQGVLPVTAKRVDPPWRPTASMRRENPRLPTYVPGGHPRNPMGVRALYLGQTLYRIHGTDAPWTIGQAVSKGCIRMYNDDVVHLYKRTNIGTKVVVTWRKYRRRA